MGFIGMIPFLRKLDWMSVLQHDEGSNFMMLLSSILFIKLRELWFFFFSKGDWKPVENTSRKRFSEKPQLKTGVLKNVVIIIIIIIIIMKNRKWWMPERIELPNQEKIRTWGKKGNLEMLGDFRTWHHKTRGDERKKKINKNSSGERENYSKSHFTEISSKRQTPRLSASQDTRDYS